MSILVIDEHPLMREAMAALIRRLSPAMNVIELDRLEAIAPASQMNASPELICLELNLADAHGVAGVRQLRQRFLASPIVVLTAESAKDYEKLCLEAGANVFLQKSATSKDISNALQPFLHDTIASEAALPQKLSKRQKQLLVLLDKGMSNRDIADTLQISEHTVKVHLWRLFRRLNVKSRSQASHLARNQGLL